MHSLWIISRESIKLFSSKTTTKLPCIGSIYFIAYCRGSALRINSTRMILSNVDLERSVHTTTENLTKRCSLLCRVIPLSVSFGLTVIWQNGGRNYLHWHVKLKSLLRKISSIRFIMGAFKNYDLSAADRQNIEIKHKQRLALRAEYWKKITNPARHATGEGGHLVNIDRWFRANT